MSSLTTSQASRWQQWLPRKDEPWDVQRVVHLRHRAGFAATWDKIQRDIKEAPTFVVIVVHSLDDSLLAPVWGKIRVSRPLTPSDVRLQKPRSQILICYTAFTLSNPS